MKHSEKIDWIFKQHADSNHMYDNYIPYEFHLRMVSTIALKNIGMVPDNGGGAFAYQDTIYLAALGHDLIEDTRVTYNDVKKVLGHNAAEIIYALTNEKGRNRKERANEKYYEGIRNTEGAVFVKLCDRLANVHYSLMTGSPMFNMYKSENDNFGRQLGFIGTDGVTVHYPGQPYYKLFMQLVELFKNN
jgi:(p)ppGpp synthase/HD superfamily hydrolase